MSAKFASITAGLLARKGEAQPWNGLLPEADKAPLAWRNDVARSEPMPAAAATPPSPPSKDRSCSVRMSAHDYERLGIIAVKTGVTRQQLLKEALAQFLSGKARTLSCACLGACENRCEN
jgi:hypothetical protein